jgi:hypothetical protein
MKELRVDVGLDAAISQYEFVELETLYNYFTSLRENIGVKTFQEYIDWKMENDGYRA